MVLKYKAVVIVKNTSRIPHRTKRRTYNRTIQIPIVPYFYQWMYAINNAIIKLKEDEVLESVSLQAFESLNKKDYNHDCR